MPYQGGLALSGGVVCMEERGSAWREGGLPGGVCMEGESGFSWHCGKA